MKKIIIIGFILTNLINIKAQSFKNSIKKLFTDSSIVNDNQFSKGKFQVAFGYQTGDFYNKSAAFLNNFNLTDYNTTSVFVRYFASDHLAIRMGYSIEPYNSTRITSISKGSQESLVDLYADVSTYGKEKNLNIEYFWKTNGRVKPFISLNSFMGYKKTRLVIDDQKFNGQLYGTPYHWERQVKNYRALLFGIGASAGSTIILTKHFFLNVEYGVRLANLKNLDVAESEIVYTSNSFDNSNSANVEFIGLNKKKTSLFGTLMGTNLCYRF